MDGFIQDLRLSFRSITRTPGMSLAAILTLALGIGANTAIFGVIDALFLRPPAHVVAPEQVHRLGSTAGSIRSWARYLDFKAHAHTVRVAAYFGPRPLSLGQGAEAKEIQSMLVTADFFPLLGVAPRLGRFFTEEEAAPGGAQVAVVSEEYWRNELGASSDALGRPLQVGRQSYTIIGVAPARFSGVDLTRPDLWLPMGVAAPVALWADVLNCGRCSWLNLVARRQAGITPAAATSELTSLFRATVIQAGDSTASVTLGPLMQPVGTDAARGARVSTWLGVACVVVLLVACVNVANLLLTRASRRRREIAVRVALGSRRMQLIRQLYLESGLLALAGGAAALLTSLWAGPALMRLLLPTSPAEPVRIRVLLFTSAVALVTTVLAGLAPVLHATTPDLATALKSGTREGGGRRSLTQTGLLVAQVALTLTLLTGASLFLRSLDRVHAQRLGFEPEQVMVVSGNIQSVRPNPAAVSQEFARLRERAAMVPGVTGTALSVGFPFRMNIGAGLVAPGADSVPDMPGPYLTAASAEYLGLLGTRLLRGRGLAATDVAGSERVIVVSEMVARRIWPGREALGQCLKLSDATMPCRTVVGVVEDGRQDRLVEPAAQLYIPLTQLDDPNINMPITSLVIRTAGPAVAMVGPVRRAVQSASADLPYLAVEPMTSLFADELRPWKLGAMLFTLFGGLAMVLGAIGVYGVLSYSMSQRTHEFGVRMTLGARPSQLVRQVVGNGVRIAVLGVVIGTAGGLLAGRALASLVYGVSPYDPLNLVFVALLLVLVAALASLLPALRASRVDPMVALRSE